MMGSWGAWGWMALGFALIGAEMLILPGGFPLWIGIAALVMAAIVALAKLSWQVELIIFGLLAIAACIIAWKVHYRAAKVDAASNLNDRVELLIDREFVLEQAIEGGFGRIRIDDTSWRVSGPDMVVGARVRVTGADGGTLKVVRV